MKRGKEFVSLFLVFSLMAVNCSVFKFPKTKLNNATYNEPSQNIRLRSEIEAFKIGTPIVVILHSRVKMSGDYAGLFYTLTEEYAENYTKSREQNREEILLPALRQNIDILTERGTHYECEFIGFDHRYLIVRWPGEEKIFTVSLKIIKNIVFGDDNIIEAKKMSNLISNGKITPLLSSGIVLQGKRGITQIPWVDVYELKKKDNSFNAAALVLFGMGGFIVVLLIIVKAVEKSIEETTETMVEESCTWSAATSNSPLSAHLDILREFRDKYLLPHKFGRELVRLYYKYSPYAANIIVKHNVLKAVVRTNLIPLIVFSYSMVHLGPIMTDVILIFIFMLPFFIVMFQRRKLRQVR